MHPALINQDGVLRRDALEELRQELEEMLFKLGHKFIRKYHNFGWDHSRFDEVMSEVYIRFIDAYDKYKGNVPMSQWVWLRVNLNLREVIREQVTRETRVPTCQLAEGFEGTAEGPPFVEGLLTDLSDDAATVIRLICEQPEYMTRHFDRARVADKTNYIRAVSRTLKEAGWTFSRLRDSFREIRKALR